MTTRQDNGRLISILSDYGFKATFGNEVQTDLDKLIFTIKNLHSYTETSQFPKFWNEEWLKKAISEIDLKAMTPEQVLAYETTISANALAVKNENKKIQEALDNKVVETIKNALEIGLPVEQCAKIAGVSLDFALKIQRQLSAN
jgi:hypothetical protein